MLNPVIQAGRLSQRVRVKKSAAFRLDNICLCSRLFAALVGRHRNAESERGWTTIYAGWFC